MELVVESVLEADVSYTLNLLAPSLGMHTLRKRDGGKVTYRCIGIGTGKSLAEFEIRR